MLRSTYLNFFLCPQLIDKPLFSRYKIIIKGLGNVHETAVLGKIIGNPQHITTKTLTPSIPKTIVTAKTSKTPRASTITTIIPSKHNIGQPITTTETLNVQKSSITPIKVNTLTTSSDDKKDHSDDSLNMTEEIFDEVNSFLSQVSDELLNMTTEETKNYVHKQKLLKMLEQDLEQFEKEKKEILIENKSIITQFKYLRSKKKKLKKNN